MAAVVNGWERKGEAVRILREAGTPRLVLPEPGLGTAPPSHSGTPPSLGLQLHTLVQPPGATFDGLPSGKAGVSEETREGSGAAQGREPGVGGAPRRLHAPVPELLVLQLEVPMQRLQAAVLADEGLVLGGLVLVERRQVLVVLQQRLVGRRQPLLLLLQVLDLALLGRLLVLEQRILRGERGALRAQGGILHLPGGRSFRITAGRAPGSHTPRVPAGRDRAKSRRLSPRQQGPSGQPTPGR